jgi:hypothetical protein
MLDEQWIPFCEIRPGPDWKQGYTFFRGYANENWGKGAVVHSMEGPYQAALGVLDGSEQSSWTVSIRKVGPPVQHYPIHSITWHCGRYGDDAGLYAGNACLLGIEVEGDKYEPMTLSQIAWLIKVLAWYWKRQKLGEPSRPGRFQTILIREAPKIDNDELWEHREISPTDCPSDRIPWGIVIKGITMAQETTEWERYTKLLELELQYLERVKALADDIAQQERRLIAVWRRSDSEPPLDHEVFKEVGSLCQQMRAAISDLEGRCHISGRG